MDTSAFLAAVAAANLLHAANLQAIEKMPNSERVEVAARESTRHNLEMATIGCSSVPPCRVSDRGKSDRCTLQAAEGAKFAPSGAVVELGGSLWAAQSGYEAVGKPFGLKIHPDSSIDVVVHSGERPWFDPPRKFRAEFCGLERYPKGVPIRFHFSFLIDASTSLDGLAWASIAQIHAADMHYADGSYVEASPILALNLKPGRNGDVIEIAAATANTDLRTPEIDPATGKQASDLDGPKWIKHFPNEKSLGLSPTLARDTWHNADIEMVDGHGGIGSLSVKIDGKAVLDKQTLPTGYSFADRLADVPYAGGRQDNGSYVKFGVYAGLPSGQAPPQLGASVRYKDILEGR